MDIWSVGTIFVELVWRAPFLPGETDMDQLKRIFTMLGSPSETEWPVSRGYDRQTLMTQGHTTLPDYHDMSGLPKQNWQSIIASLGQEGIDLIVGLLRLGPTRRPSARQVTTERC